MEYNLRGAALEASRLVTVTTLISSNEDRSRKGGYISFAIGGISHLESYQIGQVDAPAKLDKYLRFSREKILRATADWLRDPNTFSSWQTRDPGMDRYGGAVLFENPEGEFPRAISFSGLKEHCDEAVALLTGEYLGLNPIRGSADIIQFSNNQVYREMVRFLEETM